LACGVELFNQVLSLAPGREAARVRLQPVELEGLPARPGRAVGVGQLNETDARVTAALVPSRTNGLSPQ
jgi:hypothetical protein